MCNLFVPVFADSSAYAHHVFNAFDANKNGVISFRVSRSTAISFFYYTARQKRGSTMISDQIESPGIPGTTAIL